MKEVTLKEFLRHHEANRKMFIFAKDLSLEQFLSTCENGDRILWLFSKTNPNSLQELILAKGHCANTVRELMKDKRSQKAVDVAIAFGEGTATREELVAARKDIRNIVSDDNIDLYAASSAGRAACETIHTVNSDWAAYRAYGAAGEIENQKLTADICRKYLPLEIWDQDLI